MTPTDVFAWVLMKAVWRNNLFPLGPGPCMVVIVPLLVLGEKQKLPVRKVAEISEKSPT